MKSLRLVVGKVGVRLVSRRLGTLLDQAPHLRFLLDPLISAHAALLAQVAKYDAQIREIAKADETVRWLMTVPGVGPVTALAFVSSNPIRTIATLV